MNPNTLKQNTRLDVVDALRGFALFAIVILHNLEHYNLYFNPPELPEWMISLDKWVWDATFFLMASKAYAAFSLLFGFSFYIQYSNEEKRGGDFRLRFVWRLFLLFLFSQVHALFYNGDILLFYSVIGLTLIPVCRLKDKTVLIIATISMLQPLEWGRILYLLAGHDSIFTLGQFIKFDDIYAAMTTGSFTEVLKSNIWDGQCFCNIWQIDNGRFFQVIALFMFGMLLGRRQYFVKSDDSISFWKKAFYVSLIAFVPLYLLKTYIPDMITNKTMLIPINIMLPSYANFALMSIVVSGFTLLWFKYDGLKLQKLLIPYGRMSLTNYISQSIIGVFIYYGFGLSLYKYTGASLTVLIGLCIFGVQLAFSRWWLSKHKQGPLETIWRTATWIKIK